MTDPDDAGGWHRVLWADAAAGGALVAVFLAAALLARGCVS